MNTLNAYISDSHLRLCEGAAEQLRFPPKPEPIVKHVFNARPERRLWADCREAVSPKFGRIELGTFLFFFALAISAITGSLLELAHLLESNTLDQTVQAIITR
jgi:hypothetical protein